MKKLIVILIALALLMPTFVVAQTPNKYAVVWGSGGGKGEQICGDNNARLMSHLLVHEYGYENIKVLINNKLSRVTALQSLNWLRQNTDENSTIILFYSGHGSAGSVSFFSHDYLNLVFQDIEYARLCVIFECCYSGNACEALSGDNRLIIASSRIDGISPTTASNSIFGQYFLKEAIKEGLGDSNSDGKVSMQEAFYYYRHKNPCLYGTISDNGDEFIP